MQTAWINLPKPLADGAGHTFDRTPGIARRAWGYPQARAYVDDYQRIELITGTARRRRWTTEQSFGSSRRATRRVSRFPRWRGGMGWRRTFFIAGGA
jgi:hypothetical protein